MITVPLAIPVTTPELFTVATPGELLLQVPPGVALLNVVVVAGHTMAVPVIALIVTALTVTILAITAVPQTLATA